MVKQNENQNKSRLKFRRKKEIFAFHLLLTSGMAIIDFFLAFGKDADASKFQVQ